MSVKTQLYMVEVGVLLRPDDKEYDFYKYMDDFEYSLYDENIIYFTSKAKAIKEARDYIREGVDLTYGMVVDMGICNLCEKQLEEIKETGSADNLWEKPRKEDIVFFKHKGEL